MCVSKVQKNMKESISSVRFGHFFELEKRSDFFLELYLLLPLGLLLKEAPMDTFGYRNVVPRLPNDLQNDAKMITKHKFLPKWVIGVLHGKYHAFLHVGHS